MVKTMKMFGVVVKRKKRIHYSSPQTPSPINYLVTPLTPYLLCNHFISTEIHSRSGWKYIGVNLHLRANNLLKNKNYNDIKDFEIIQIQVDLFDFFCNNVLPIICKNNVKVIIITSQWHIPQIQRSHVTDNLLNHKNILFWISQNPIYQNSDKYMAFPYGICHHQIKEYAQFLVSNDDSKKKSIKILNQHAAAHGHLPNDHIRKTHSIFGINSGNRLGYNEYLTNLSNAEFVISTAGDRDDCYRHYECIGLNAVPVSNITGNYKCIFDENMVYSNADEMVTMLKTNTVNHVYIKPNKNIITVSYWENKIREIIKRISELDTI
jgi:hypothetical protein